MCPDSINAVLCIPQITEPTKECLSFEIIY
jgi:hypothetical protein